MAGFRRFLVLATERSDAARALDRAVRLARMAGGSLTVLGVVDPPRIAPGVETAETAAALRALARERELLEARVDALVATARAAGVAADGQVETGLPLQVVIGTAVRGGYDLMVKSVDERPPGARSPRGPLDQSLLREHPGALWIEQPGVPADLRRVLVAINPDPAAPEEVRLSVDLLCTAAIVARSAGAELQVLHAWKLFGEWRSVYDRWTDPELAPILGATLDRHVGYVDRALAEAGLAGAAVRRHIVHQRASQAIIDTVRSEGIDLLVMGTVGRTGIPGFLIGNTAERVLGEVECSVLARKPNGFVSPVLV
jgi:nucleotide-binding universal stress UspA family protein